MSNGNGTPDPGAVAQAIASHPAMAPVLQQMAPADAQNLLARVTTAVAGQGGVLQAPGARGRRQRTHSVEDALPPERTRLWNTYYSIVRFQAEVSVAAPVTTLTFPIQELRPFSYKIGDNVPGDTASGMSPATEAETNLVKANETIAGELVKVHGLSLMPSLTTDVGLWKDLETNLSVAISMNGDAQRYRLGRMSFIPASGGTIGAGYTFTETPGLNESFIFDQQWSNGWPTIDNFFPFPEPMIWSPSGETDSNFNISLKQQRQFVITETARAAASGVAPFAPPTAPGQPGTYVDVMARLHSEQMAPRSVNQ